MGWGIPGLTEPPPHLPGGGSRAMPADALKCKECQPTSPLEARFVCERCFGPLEVNYSLPDGDPAALKRRIQAGPHNIWRYADFLPLQGPARSALPPGWTPVRRGCARLGGAATSRTERRTRTPAPLPQSPASPLGRGPRLGSPAGGRPFTS